MELLTVRFESAGLAIVIGLWQSFGGFSVVESVEVNEVHVISSVSFKSSDRFSAVEFFFSKYSELRKAMREVS